ncbi:MAG: hypothetical protein MJZ50_01735 [Treponema sp.]|nr:hypothetical protein [Treponema sp.]
MGAIAGIASSVISGTAQSGQKGNMEQGQVAQNNGGVSNAGSSAVPEMKEAKIEKAADPITGNAEPVKVENKSDSNSKGNIDWGALAEKAQSLANGGNGNPQPIVTNNVAGNQPIANFR